VYPMAMVERKIEFESSCYTQSFSSAERHWRPNTHSS
jgi:hypothetical protein